MSEAVIIAVVVSLMAPVILEAIKQWSAARQGGANRQQTDEERMAAEVSAVRQEQRKDIQDLRDEVKRLQTELETWRTRYYELLGKHSQLSATLERVKDDMAELRHEVKDHQGTGP